MATRPMRRGSRVTGSGVKGRCESPAIRSVYLLLHPLTAPPRDKPVFAKQTPPPLNQANREIRARPWPFPAFHRPSSIFRSRPAILAPKQERERQGVAH